MTLVLQTLHLEQFRTVALAAAQAAVSVFWQSAVLVAAAALALRLHSRLSASVRFLIWAAVFGVCVGLPLLHLSGGHAAGIGSSSPLPRFRLDPRWSYAVAGLWVSASLFRMVGLAVQAARLRSLWKSAVPVPREMEDAALSSLHASGTGFARRDVELCTSTEVDRPSVIGFLAPRILVPEWLFEQLSVAELQHLVLHEMEHLRRRDDWMNLVQKVALAVFPLNLWLFLIDGRLAAERERACDDGVLAATHRPRAYAACLASIAEQRMQRRVHRRVVALALGALGRGGMPRGRPEFSRRIESILSQRVTTTHAASAAMAGVMIVGIVGAGFGMAHAPELISFAPQPTPGPASSVSASVLQAQGAPTSSLEARRVVFHQQTAAHRRAPEASSHVAGARSAVAERALPMETSPVQTRTIQNQTVQTRAIETRASQPRSAQASDQQTPRWFVLTSAEQNAPARVVVRTPDGRFFVAPYAAVPVSNGIQDGWLILQL